MAGINKAILIGNLGRDPEIRYTPNGTAVANFTIATTETISTKDGGREDRTEWHRIVAFGRLAEICGEYLAKGRQVYIEGRIQTRDWEDRDGNKRTTTEIIANTMQMLGSPPSGAGSRSSASQRTGRPAEKSPAVNNAGPDYDGPPPDNDIPF